MRILVLSKRQYTNKDLLDDRFGRLREIPLALADKGHSIRGLCLSYRNRSEGKHADGTASWDSINAWQGGGRGIVRFILKAYRNADRADIIWACSDSVYGILGYLIARTKGIPLVFDIYDNFASFLIAKLPLIEQCYRYVIRNCDGITCVSGPLSRLLVSYGRKLPTWIVENGVRKDLFAPLEQQYCRNAFNLPITGRLIGTAGAMDQSRGIGTLFETFKMLSKREPDLHLVFAGPRDQPVPRGANIHDLGIISLDKVPILFNALDVAVICNRESEFGKYCFPQKSREIMACDVPIVAARTGSMAEMFKDRPEWLYRPDDPQDLMSVLEARLMDRRTSYGHIPSWEEIALQVENVFFKTITAFFNGYA